MSGRFLLNVLMRDKQQKPDKPSKILLVFMSEYSLLFFFIAALVYLELLYRMWIFKKMGADFLFPFLFALSAGTMLYILVSLFPNKAARALSVLLTVLLTLCYGVQLIYFCIFRTPLLLYSLSGASDALQFQGIIMDGILNNIVAVVLLFVPLVILTTQNDWFDFSSKKPLAMSLVLLFCVCSHLAAILCINITGDSPASQKTLYYKSFAPVLSVDKLGLLTTMQLDLNQLIAGAIHNISDADKTVSDTDKTAEMAGDYRETGGKRMYGTEKGSEKDTTPQGVSANPDEQYNMMDIDFDALAAGAKSANLAEMHKYFSKIPPASKNKYTGIFRGCNLIMITAEGFSPYVISPELTPTLYRMSTEGFVFKNFYNPIWWVSTSDGEYVVCTGLLPKRGVWSLAKSGENHMPFALGNQFRKLGYITKAYHNHTYTYYKRHISHPNLGYEYKGVGNGLVVKKTWPESDLEMIMATADEYIGKQPFHTYYMTVSGHMNYSFSGNEMANKNKDKVKDLPYSNTSKAYIACNLELEYAMEALVDKLEAAGIAENTVIAVCSDHYPYGLEKRYIDELAGHEVEENFELYKSTFILWKKGMKPVVIDKPCSALDILPTLSNLFGLEYDSRLLMGSDILSEDKPLVIFSNLSWKTDKAVYNSAADKVEFTGMAAADNEYAENVHRLIANKFKYSAMILETDYYGKVFPVKYVPAFK